jgi:hypothetical protein
MRKAGVLGLAGVLMSMCAGANAAGGPPSNVSRPLITGDPHVGHTFTVSKGAWTGEPTRFLYQFVRCPAICNPVGGGWKAVEAPTPSAKYKITPADQGHQLYAIVQATNSDGSNSIQSLPSALVAGTYAPDTTTAATTAANPAQAPVALFKATLKTGTTELLNAATSHAHKPATIKRFAWAFGDGKTGSGRLVSHRYAHGGVFVVSLTVTDSKGRIGSTAYAINVG